jgi:hypothetical protein
VVRAAPVSAIPLGRASSMSKGKTKGGRKPKRDKPVEPRSKWTELDHAAGEEIAVATNTPGQILVLPLTALPNGIAKMPGAISYFVSAYTAPKVVSPALTVGGEMAVLRTDAGLRKAYNYVFATSSDGKLYFNGPYKDFTGHHVAAQEPIVYFIPLGNTPFSD